MDDLAGADHARVADVDHVRVGHVQRDPEAEQEDDADASQRRGDRAGAAAAVGRARRCAAARTAGAQREHPREQVEQRRIGERHRGPDVRVVEERERDREGEQHEQVEVQQREGPAPVEEGNEEQQAQRYPHVERVDVLAERARVAARHRPGDLEAGPLFEHAPARVGDDHLADLLRALRREEAHLPAQRALEIGAAVGAGVFPAHRAHLRQRFGDFEHAIGGQVAPGGRDLGGGDGDGASAIVAWGVGRRRPCGGVRRRSLRGRRGVCFAGAGEANRDVAALRGGRRRRARRRQERRAARERVPRGCASSPRVTGVRWAAQTLRRGRARSARARAARCRGSPTGPADSAGRSTPQRTSAPSESEACSEPWLPPPTWAAPPQSRNS